MRKPLAIIVLVTGSIGCAQSQPDFSWQDRLRYYLYRTYSWQRFATLAGETVVDHLMDDPKEWGRDPQTYGYRYSSAFGCRLVRNSIELGLGAAFKEDTRYTPSQARGFRARVRHAFLQAFLTSGEHGRFAYSRLGAMAGCVLITSAWHPPPLSASQFANGIAYGYESELENSFLTEFSPDMKRVGRRLRLKLFGR